VGRVVVGGALAQRPGNGGHAWALLNYLLGFRALGHEVLFLDRLAPEMAPSPAARMRCVSWLVELMEGAGLASSYSLFLGGDETVGLDREAAIEQVRDSIILLDVMGFVEDEEVLAASSRNVFLDIDPGFGQMWKELGLHDAYAGHDAFVTVGEKIGEPDCLVPTCGIEWVTSPHPIVLEEWPLAAGGSRFSSVGSWRGPYDPVEYEGRRFGLRAHELRKLIRLPSLVEPELELALEIDPADAADLEALREHGWVLVDPAEAAGDPDAYRRFIQGSQAELMVAKEMYVEARSGWFSERSIAYLASGKPVLAQDTGFAERYPCGEGLLAFDDLDGAREGIERICADPERHSRAAREIAAEHFEAKKVLGRLLEKVAG
jgi:glycosyltransferase involved in cell wall biosynthesis